MAGFESQISNSLAKTSFSHLHASNILNNNITSYSQWFPGKHNDLADSARIEHVVLVSIQGDATRLGIKRQAIGANTFSEQIAVGIGAFADSACLEAVDFHALGCPCPCRPSARYSRRTAAGSARLKRRHEA